MAFSSDSILSWPLSPPAEADSRAVSSPEHEVVELFEELRDRLMHPVPAANPTPGVAAAERPRPSELPCGSPVRHRVVSVLRAGTRTARQEGRRIHANRRRRGWETRRPFRVRRVWFGGQIGSQTRSRRRAGRVVSLSCRPRAAAARASAADGGRRCCPGRSQRCRRS